MIGEAALFERSPLHGRGLIRGRKAGTPALDCHPPFRLPEIPETPFPKASHSVPKFIAGGGTTDITDDTDLGDQLISYTSAPSALSAVQELRKRRTLSRNSFRGRPPKGGAAPPSFLQCSKRPCQLRRKCLQINSRNSQNVAFNPKLAANIHPFPCHPFLCLPLPPQTTQILPEIPETPFSPKRRVSSRNSRNPRPRHFRSAFPHRLCPPSP